MKDVSVADIIFAVDEPLDATQCGGKENCVEEGPCMTHELWSNLNRRMIEYLDSVSLGDLVEGQRAKDAESTPKHVSVLREHRAALEFPTSTLQPIRVDGTRVTTAT
jgi:Rrf2 family iron-sulfur cluster assembly transcriptional regulator